MFRCLRPTRKTSRPLRSILNPCVRSYKYQSSRCTLLLQRSHLSPLLQYMVLDYSQALKSHRCYPLSWRLGYSSQEHRPICQVNEYPISQWNEHSADTFDASTSRFPSHSEMHKSKRPSKELIRYVRRRKHELRLDCKKTSPRWQSERDVMRAACIVFLLKYKPNRERREEGLKEFLKVLKIGLQADSQSSPPRWNAIQRRNIRKLAVRMEGMHAFEVPAVKYNEDDEWEAGLGCSCLVILISILS